MTGTAPKDGMAVDGTEPTLAGRWIHAGPSANPGVVRHRGMLPM